MKSNVHIASKFLQVRCNLQAGHLERSLSQIKSSYHYWCGDYALKKSNAVTVQGERDLELTPAVALGGWAQIGSVSLSLPTVKTEITTVTGFIWETYQKVE